MTDLRDKVREKYAGFITQKAGCGCGAAADGCCGGGTPSINPITGGLYDRQAVEGLPEDLLATSLGCGNPTALVELHAGERVLDLGSGAGLDVLLSARRVGPTGKAYGLDMTEEMLDEARKNQQIAGVENAEFLRGHIEEIPLPDQAVDVIISNCVINLSGDKDQVLKEAFRVLRFGGRLAVSDIVVTKELPESVRRSLTAWAGCIAGALSEAEYRQKLTAAGFEEVEVQITRVYDIEEAAAMGLDLTAEEKAALPGALVSAFIRARKPKKIVRVERDCQIRQAAAKDVTEICHLLQSSNLPVCGVETEISDFFVIEEKEPDGKGNSIWGVIGLSAKGAQGLLRSLAVRPERRGNGVAEALVRQSLHQGERQGLKEFYLLTNTAERYATRFGFQTLERREFPENLLEGSLKEACAACGVCMKLVI